MSDRGKVSVVIPTWQRPDDCIHTIHHIQDQTYKNIEVIVVSDGKDEILAAELNSYFMLENQLFPREVDDLIIRFVELGCNWSSLLPNSFGIAPLLVGYLIASGEYIMPWCDDERALTKKHIEYLVNAINAPIGMHGGGEPLYPDFVYPRVKIWRNGDPDGPETAVIGLERPVYGHITHYLFRPENFIKFGFPEWGTHPVDWALVEKWMQNGAHWLFTDMLTFEHRLDQ